MNIQLSDGAVPIQKPARHVPMSLKDKFEQEIHSMEKQGIISKLHHNQATEWLNVPAMGLSNSNDLFVSALRELLQGLEGVVNITNDILVFGPTQHEYNINVITFMERCLEVNLKLNLRKIRLNCFEVPFFGQGISAEGIKPDANKVKAIKDWPVPSNVKELQSFLGLVKYLSSFVPKLSSLRAQLQPLVIANTDFIWLKSHSEAFERIKNTISNDCLLQFYGVSHPLLIECDASKKGLGCILLQPMGKNITNQDISDFSENEIEEFLSI